MTDENTAGAEQPQATDMRATMAAAFDAIEAREKAEPVADAAPAAAPADAEPIKERGDGRDDKGRFVAKPKEPEAAPETAAPVKNPDQGVEPERAATTPSAPESWSADAKAAWQNVPPAIQAEILKRETDVTKGFAQRAAIVKDHEQISQALAPVRQQLELNGISPARYVAQLRAADQFLRSDPRNAIKWLAQTYGVNLHEINQPGNDQQPLADPHIAAVTQKVDTLARSVEEQKIERANEAIRAFATAAGPDGKPLRPHFEAVQSRMTELLSAGAARSLEDAYDMAVWSSKDIRERIQQDQRAAEDAKLAAEKAKAIEDAKRKAEEAERAARVNRATAPKGVGTNPAAAASIRDTMARVYDRVTAA